MTTRRNARAFTTSRGFTMVELMTVLTIIVILITIVIPVVSSVRKKAAAASVGAQLSAIAGAMDRYHQEFGAYPGPVSDDMMYPGGTAPGGNVLPGEAIYKLDGTPIGDGATHYITETENAVLGLCGGLRPRTGAPGYEFDPGLVGGGPRNLNPAKPKRYDPFLETAAGSQKLLTDRPDKQPAEDAGDYRDGAGEGQDSAIPEILDRFGSPMPILILRAKIGAAGVVSIGGFSGALQATGGTVHVPPVPPAGVQQTQYDLNQIAPYVMQYNGRSIGEGKSIRAKDYYTAGSPTPPTGADFPHGLQSVNDSMTLNAKTTYPYDAFPYFNNPSIPPSSATATAGGGPGDNLNSDGTPKQKDKYILISAGIDRVYGTADDITQFGSVAN